MNEIYELMYKKQRIRYYWQDEEVGVIESDSKGIPEPSGTLEGENRAEAGTVTTT